MTASAQISDVQVPDDLGELDRWAVWRREIVKGHEAKVPYSTRGRRADSTNPNDWGELDAARKALATGRYTGLAFVFFERDGLVGIDLDNSLDTEGTVKPWARGIVERFADTYTEISPSGHGLKIWTRGTLPSNVSKVRSGDGGVETYSSKRYFCFTGDVFRGAPLQLEDHAADVLRLHEHLMGLGNRRTWPLQPLQGGRIPYGQQHSTLVSIAGTLRARRVCDQAIEACLLAVNAHQCEQPGPPENIRRIVYSSRRWGGAA